MLRKACRPSRRSATTVWLALPKKRLLGSAMPARPSIAFPSLVCAHGASCQGPLLCGTRRSSVAPLAPLWLGRASEIGRRRRGESSRGKRARDLDLAAPSNSGGGCLRKRAGGGAGDGQGTGSRGQGTRRQTRRWERDVDHLKVAVTPPDLPGWSLQW